MMPVGPLMKEHRVIERMVDLLEKELKSIEGKGKADISFIEVAIDFIKTYADRTHHGKEEGILFRDLRKKNISDDHNKIMEKLIQDHEYGRKLISQLFEAKERYTSGFTSAVFDIIDIIKKLVDFYPGHIEKEDKHFFIPVMEYFSRKEQDNMLKEFQEFDKNIVHEKYREIVESFESKA